MYNVLLGLAWPFRTVDLIACVCVRPVRQTTEPEDSDEREEDEDEEEVVPESESYVHLRKKMVRRHEQRMDNVLQENGKLCREYRRKQVGDLCLAMPSVT